MHGDLIDLPSIIYHHILHVLHMSGKKIGLPYAYLIRRLVIGLGITITDRVFKRVPRPIGQVTLAQSRSYISSSSKSSNNLSLPS